MYFIGIDFSINYASYCISEDFNTFKFGTIINDKSLSLKKRDELIYLSELLDDFEVIFTDRACNKKAGNGLDYVNEERYKLLNRISLSTKMINQINAVTGYSKNVILGIEGFSYGSKGQAAFDIPLATGILRRDLLIDLLNADINKMFVFSPSELKNALGCKGNAGKDVLFDKFVTDPVLEKIIDSDFFQYVLEHKDDKTIKNVTAKGIKIESPINDMIDAYLSIVKIHNIINEK